MKRDDAEGKQYTSKVDRTPHLRHSHLEGCRPAYLLGWVNKRDHQALSLQLVNQAMQSMHG